mgnify:CR=1 FL=1
MQSEKANDYINRLSNLQDKCYTHIVSTKAVEIAIDEVSEKLSAMLETEDIDKLKNGIKQLINNGYEHKSI